MWQIRTYVARRIFQFSERLHCVISCVAGLYAAACSASARFATIYLALPLDFYHDSGHMGTAIVLRELVFLAEHALLPGRIVADVADHLHGDLQIL